MNNSKVWVLITGVVVMVSGFLLYSTLRSKQAERTSFLGEIQTQQNKIAELSRSVAELEEVRKEKAELEAKAQQDIAALEAQISDFKKNETSLRSKIDTLTKEKDALNKYMENNNAIVAKLQKKIEAMEREKKQILENIARKADAVPRFIDPMSDAAALEADEEKAPLDPGARLSDTEAVDLGRIVIRRATEQPATVEHINTLYGFVVLSAGSDDGLRKDSVVNITRNNRLVAKAVVKKVRPEAASAVTLPEWTREEIRVGDLVSVNDFSS